MKYLLSALLFVTFAAHAGSFNAGYGTYKEISRTSISYTGDSIYQLWGIDVKPEIGLVRFRDNVSGDAINQIYLTPALTYRTGNFTIDGGIGLSWLDGRQLGTKTLSTNFQFTDHIGVSYKVSKNVSIGYRITHVSNADIKKPNPGIDGQQLFLRYTY